MRAGLFLLSLLAFAAPALSGETGRFTVYAAGREAGSEVFTLGDDGRLTSEANLSRDGRVQALRLSLEMDEEGLRRFEARGAQGEVQRVITLDRQDGVLVGERREGETATAIRLTPAPGALVFVEPFAAPWVHVAGRYDRARGGDQIFPAVFPLDGEVGTVTVTHRGEEPVEIDGRAFLATRYFVRPSRGEAANLWVAEDGRLIVCARSVAGISAVRGGVARIGLEAGEDPPDPPGTVSRRVRFAARGTTLAGTFLRPEEGDGPLPAVLLLAGSGPQDRNGNAPGTELQWNHLHAFSVALAARGIASLRFDERGVGRSGGTVPDTDLDLLLADAESARAYLASREDVDSGRVAVLGHSEGAILGALLAGTPGRVRALVTLGAPARSLDRILLDQVRRRLEARETPTGERERMLGELRAYFEHVRLSEAEVVEWNGRVRNVGWLRDHLRLDLNGVYGKVSCPALVLHGDRDLQVPVAEALGVVRLLAGTPEAKRVVLTGCDHFGIRARGERADYGDARRRVAPEALRAVAEWLSGRLR